MRHSLVAAGLLFAQVLAGRTIVVNQKHRLASDENPGTAQRPLKTINAAAQIAQPGDTVLVRAGTYRERVATAPVSYVAHFGVPPVCGRGSVRAVLR